MAEAVARVMVVDMVNNKAAAMAANRAVMGGRKNAVMSTIMSTVMNAEMTIHMDSSKARAMAGAMAGNKEDMVEMANAATSDATMILTGNSKAEVMAGVNKAEVMPGVNKAGVMAEVNKAGFMAEVNKAEVMVEVNKAGVMEEGSKVVAMAEVNKADITKVAVVATALMTVLAEDMEGEGISFKKVEDQVKALGVISIPTKL
jgi:hypothetical protein